MKLKEYRKWRGLSKKETFQTLDITRQYLWELEEKDRPPGRKLADKIIKWSENHVKYEDLWR